MTGALSAAVCEVIAVTHYHRQRMMESIDRVRLYQHFRNTMMLIVSSLHIALPILVAFHYLHILSLVYLIFPDAE
jgi:hypothetical protein